MSGPTVAVPLRCERDVTSVPSSSVLSTRGADPGAQPSAGGCTPPVEGTTFALELDYEYPSDGFVTSVILLRTDDNKYMGIIAVRLALCNT
jgi:hypothetical protein